MQEKLPIEQYMPVFSPKYDPAVLKKLTDLKQRLNQKIFDEETNKLAEIILKKDQSNYNAWYCKKMYFLSKKDSIQHQAAFAHSCLGDKAKSFQVWEQKRFLFQYHKNGEYELTTSRKILESIDAKNYHAWSFRVWLVNELGVHKQELSFATQMIKQDCFNNSAWSYRFFLIEKIIEKQPERRKQILSQQIDFTLQQIRQAKSNKSSWNYLRGLFPSIHLKNISSKNSIRKALIESYDQFPIVSQQCQVLWSQITGQIDNSNQKIAQQMILFEREVLCTLVHIHSQKQETKKYAKSVCQQLFEKQKQKIHYWKWIHSNL